MAADCPWVPFMIDLELAIFRNSMSDFDKLSFKPRTIKTLQQSLSSQLFEQVGKNEIKDWRLMKTA